MYEIMALDHHIKPYPPFLFRPFHNVSASITPQSNILGEAKALVAVRDSRTPYLCRYLCSSSLSAWYALIWPLFA